MYNINIAKAGRVIPVDFDALPDAAKAYVIKYGLTQALNDTTAGIARKDYKSDADFISAANDAVDKKLAAIMSGELRQSSGRVTNPLDAQVMKMARARVMTALMAKGFKTKDIATKDLNERALAYIAKKGQSLRDEAQAELDKLAASAVDIDI